MKTNPIKTEVLNIISNLLPDNSVAVSDEVPLIGTGSLLDSMKLVELCLMLEDLGRENGFEFDWTSDTAMSKSRSMFRTCGTLANEFVRQMEEKK